jgi:thiosulfate dehydrogenase
MTELVRQPQAGGDELVHSLKTMFSGVTEMHKFLIGFVAAIVVTVVAAFCYVRFGFVDPRADVAVDPLERKIAMPSLDAAIDRRAPVMRNTVEPTEANLIAGVKIYQADCASCHGDVTRPHGMLAEALYPRAPQFFEDAPDMPENQNYYIIRHGIRLSGMPAWDGTLSDQEMWQVTTLLRHLDKLPPQVSDAWRAMASASPDAKPLPEASKLDMKDKKDMAMQ